MKPPEFMITGELGCHAASGVDSHGVAWLRVEVAQPGRRPPIVAVHYTGATFAHQYSTSNKAHQLRRGTRVTVLAEGLAPRRRPRSHIMCEGVTAIEQHDLPPPRHEPAEPPLHTIASDDNP